MQRQLTFSHPVSLRGSKRVGNSTASAWPGRKQTDILVKVDWHDSEEVGSRKVVYYCTRVPL
jgi:hypothetical protein